MRSIRLEQREGRFCVLALMGDGSEKCYGRYRTEPEARRRLLQVAKSADLAPPPADPGELAASYRLDPPAPRA
jgi:hypothetical protein